MSDFRNKNAIKERLPWASAAPETRRSYLEETKGKAFLKCCKVLS